MPAQSGAHINKSTLTHSEMYKDEPPDNYQHYPNYLMKNGYKHLNYQH